MGSNKSKINESVRSVGTIGALVAFQFVEAARNVPTERPCVILLIFFLPIVPTEQSMLARQHLKILISNREPSGWHFMVL